LILLKHPKVLFLKSRKTAGTSFEIALSKFADENSVITPITLEDENTRQTLGFKGPQNYLMSKAERLIYPQPSNLKNFKFWNHIPAKFVKERLGADEWSKSFKISIVRNPYDRAVSRYFWDKKSVSWSTDDFENYCVSIWERFAENLEQYFIDRIEIIDFYIRYESIQQDIVELEERFPALLGLREIFSNLRAKGHYRPQHASTSEIFSRTQTAKQLISKICRFEIEKFGYQCP